MATKKTVPDKKPVSKKASTGPKRNAGNTRSAPGFEIPKDLQAFLDQTPIPKGYITSKKVTVGEVRRRMNDLNLRPGATAEKIRDSINRIKPAPRPEEKMPDDVRASIRALKPEARRFHGAKVALSWFPFPSVTSSCADRFGYMSSTATRNATKLPFNAVTQALLNDLGNLMGNVGRDPNPLSHNPADDGVSTIPAGFTYFGQFVDHDITRDISSTLDADTDANTINNMRSPALDLDSLYGRGPGVDPFLYAFPGPGLPPTAIKFQTGTNLDIGRGGPSSNGTPSGMAIQTNWDVPRIPGTLTAVIGDPRNDENLIVVQIHHAMLRFHNAVVDLLLAASFAGDIFAEAKRIVTHHYQWAVVNDFLTRICGAPAVTAALATIGIPAEPFRMPVEFAVAAYRFGHSMIRDEYWINFNFPDATLGQVFEFNRPPRLPVFSNWVVDLNAFFDTAIFVPENNKARRIDSVMAAGLETLPGFSGLMAVLSARNLRRGLALGLPSGQGMATSFGITPMTEAELTSGLPADEVNLLNRNGKMLLKKTPLWYYVLREAAVLHGGNQLGPVGGRIVAETFVRLLKRDASSYLRVPGPGFAPMLPSAVAGDFTVADLLIFAGVTQP